jgi:hypothetical protein
LMVSPCLAYKDNLRRLREKRGDRGEVSEDSATADASSASTADASVTSRFSPAAALFTSLGDASTHRVTEEYARLEHNRKRDAGRAKRRDVRNAARIASDDDVNLGASKRLPGFAGHVLSVVKFRLPDNAFSDAATHNDAHETHTKPSTVPT